ncbi:MAG: hypothetical protein ACLU38_13645 [Dysosmobacter sp.]
MAKRYLYSRHCGRAGAPTRAGPAPLIRKVIRTALAAEGVDVPCEVDVLLTNDANIHEINREHAGQ